MPEFAASFFSEQADKPPCKQNNDMQTNETGQKPGKYLAYFNDYSKYQIPFLLMINPHFNVVVIF